MSLSIVEHEAKARGVHGIPNVNDLWNNYDFTGRWQALAGATTIATGSLFGMAAPSTIANTPANADAADGQWINFPTTTATNNVGGITTAFNLYRSTWLPILGYRIKFGSDITSQRVWLGFASAAQSGTGTGTGHIAAFRFDTGQSDTTLKAITRNNTTTTTTETGVVVAADRAMSLGIEAEGALGSEPTAWNFYVNRARVARVTATLPVSATTNLGVVGSITTLTNAIRSIRVGRLSVAVQG